MAGDGDVRVPRGDSAAAAPRWPQWRRLAGDLLLLVGGLVLAYPFWSAGYAALAGAGGEARYRATAAAFAAAVADDPASRLHALPLTERLRRLAATYARTVRPGEPVARLRIPRLGLDTVVREGVRGRASLDPEGDRALLRLGPVHYGVTPLPGAGEPFAVAGHRTTYGAPFFHLDRLRRGDVIAVETPYARFRYRVVRLTEVAPDAVDVLYDRGYGLVLTTCTPRYSASRRLVVWAALERAALARP